MEWEWGEKDQAMGSMREIGTGAGEHNGDEGGKEREDSPVA